MKTSNRIFTLSLLFVFSPIIYAEVLFEADFEGANIPYIEPNKHAGGGMITWLGGYWKGAPGDGTMDPNKYANTVLDGSADAKNSVTGSNYALKTQYAAGYAASYPHNTTIINFPDRDHVEYSGSQNWSKNWVWPLDQQKFLKVKGRDWSNNFKINGAGNALMVTGNSSNYYAKNITNNKLGTIVNEDSINNGVGPGGTDGNIFFDKNRWYHIEMMIKANTPGKSDGEFKYWIDGVLVFHLNNFSQRGSSNKGMWQIEMQHVYQTTRGLVISVDMPTWMDNIKIATTYQGPPAGLIKRVAAPTNLLKN